MKILPFRKTSPGFVYLVEAIGVERFKIGCTRSPVQRRLKDLQTASPFALRVVHHWRVYYPEMVEQALHGFFSERRVQGEWFQLSESDVQWICATHRTPKELAA